MSREIRTSESPIEPKKPYKLDIFEESKVLMGQKALAKWKFLIGRKVQSRKVQTSRKRFAQAKNFKKTKMLE